MKFDEVQAFQASHWSFQSHIYDLENIIISSIEFSYQVHTSCGQVQLFSNSRGEVLKSSIRKKTSLNFYQTVSWRQPSFECWRLLSIYLLSYQPKKNVKTLFVCGNRCFTVISIGLEGIWETRPDQAAITYTSRRSNDQPESWLGNSWNYIWQRGCEFEASSNTSLPKYVTDPMYVVATYRYKNRDRSIR